MKLKSNALVIAMCALGLGACNDDTNNITSVPNITPESIELNYLSRTESRGFAVSAAEIPAYDAQSQRLFVVNAKEGVVDIFDYRQPQQPKWIGSLDAKSYLTDSEVNSVAVKNGIVALAVQAKDKTDPGIVALFNANDSSFIAQVPVGSLPDMLTFSTDGKTLLVANEGEPSHDYAIDPEGSISIIDLSNLNKPVAKTADFKAFNSQAQLLRDQGVRIYGPNATVAQNFEPEYITLSTDGKIAWVALQENNALAKVDVLNAKVMAVYPLGFKDHGLQGHGLDVSDADGENGLAKINIQTWQHVRGLYMPDAISSYEVNGKTYIVTANEGDARAWGEDDPEYWGEKLKDNPSAQGNIKKGFVEEWRVKHLVHKDGFDRRQGEDLPPQLRALAKGAELNPLHFAYCGAIDGDAKGCREDKMLGRLNITWTEGYQKNTDGTPKLNARGNLVYDHLYSFGARSVSIWTENDAQTGLELVWDSGDDFEQYIAQHHPEIFNANHEEAGFDNRSDNKGPEPEGVVIGQIGQKTYAFIGLERVGGVMVYDISNPAQPQFVQYIHSRKLDATTADIEEGQAGDLGPEGLTFVSAKESPTGTPLLIVGNEVSGTTATYQITLK
ncbi:choice-of-anchor I family protein [Acinetobacter sp. Ver3]|uniref:choice-of-anchor I family protein n=1 Tax=Acinetobacter sp. Ver3 TaxID=466088 RepID=UPI0004510F93|nr:choice-of-anchor I family protein [Acinetobacter sp. Ver3]EZQ03770.1 alkaline phosphatase [Acinetobacter sp. Ver3]